jgi:dTMP kinase
MKRKSTQGRFESQGLIFHTRVRQGYLAIARQEPRRVRVVEADHPVATVQAEIRKIVDALLASRLEASRG